MKLLYNVYTQSISDPLFSEILVKTSSFPLSSIEIDHAFFSI